MITRWPLRWDWYVMKFGVQSFDYKELKYGFSALCTKDFFNPCFWELGVQQIISSWFFYLVVMSLLESVQIFLGELPFWLLLGVRELTNHWHANLHFRRDIEESELFCQIVEHRHPYVMIWSLYSSVLRI